MPAMNAATTDSRTPPGRIPLLLAALLIGAGTAADAEAARWVAVGGDKKARIEIDTSSIERGSDGKVRVWHRETYSPSRLQEAWAFSYASMKQLTEFQCDKRLAAALRRIYYADSGAEIKSDLFDAKDSAPVVPDSPVEAVLSRACRPPAPAKPAEPVRAEAAPEAAAEVTAKQGKRRSGKEEVPAPQKPAAAWSYEGKLGPDKWARLDDSYALCGNGKRQSPIDIRTPILADLPPIRFTYQPVPLQLLDDGHGIQANVQGGGTIAVDGEEFELQTLRFHHPGEEMANGKRAAMSVQFEHKAKSGRVAIVAVPMQAGKEHRLVRTLWSALPLDQNRPAMPADIKIDPGQLLPAKRDYATYSGSLTHPPCTEGVLWLVLKQPVLLSKEQIADFAKVYRANVRPAQAANGRVVKQSR